MDLGIACEGFFFEKVNESTGQRVTFTFHYIISASLTPHSCKRRLLLCCYCKSLNRAKGTFCCTASRLVVGVCRWTSELHFRGSFSEKVNGSTGQQVTFSHTILYMIEDDTTLSSLRPHHCKKHTASFARSMGKFPSNHKLIMVDFKVLQFYSWNVHSRWAKYYTECLCCYLAENRSICWK